MRSGNAAAPVRARGAAPREGRSIIGRLIAKDLHLYRWQIVGAFLAGVASLVVAHFGEGDNVGTGPNLGIILFMTTVITFGVLVAMFGILKERQTRAQLFVLSLPVSPAQYSFAKAVSALLAFLAPWLALTVGVVALTAASGAPQGGMPGFVLMMTLFLANFCTLMAVVVITMSELWSVVAILATNVSVPVFLANLGRMTGAAGREQEAAAVWSPAVLTVLGLELAWIALALALAFYLPSRRRDFV